MLEFVNYSLKQLKQYASMIQESPFLCNDISLGSFLIWHPGQNLKFATYHNTFIVKMNIGDEPAFSYPYGDDVDGAIDALIEYVKANDLPLVFWGIDKKRLGMIEEDKRFHTVHANYDRRWSDYLYSFEEMVSFKGRKFSKQRNHINKFKSLYGEPDLRGISEEDLPAIRELLDEYRVTHAGNKVEENELQGNDRILEHFQELGLYGVVLYVQDKAVAFSIGEIVGNMLIVHVEKALTQYSGVYPTVFNSFMRYMQSRKGESIQIVNREDDAGDLGLRTSKIRYKPICLLNKYIVRIDSPVREVPVLHFEGGVLNAIQEEDKKEYYELNTDRDNNQYWGYDYEEDVSITDLTESTFYDSQAFDHSVGASMNFAVRKREDSELIGETIIYHFTKNGKAEIGGRIARKWQQNGLGTKAFAATADYAQNELHLKVRAKCFKQNEPSYHMIMAAGFHIIGEDETFYYFAR